MMGLNCENSGWLCFDTETIALPDAAQYDTEPIEPPSNYRDPAKIEAYLIEKRQQRLDRAALNIDLAQIVAIGWQAQDDSLVYVSHAGCDVEKDMLVNFWAQIRSGTRVIGFNIRHFDLPMLIRRSQYLGVGYPLDLDLGDRRNRRILDLLEILSFGNIEHRRSLDFYAKRFGIPSDDTVSGKDIGRLVAAGDWSAVSHHCESDVRKTVALAQRLGLIGATAAQAG